MQVAGGGAPRGLEVFPHLCHQTPTKSFCNGLDLLSSLLKYYTFGVGEECLFSVFFFFSLSLLNTYFLASNIESVTSRSPTRQVPRCPSFSREQQGRGGGGVRAGDPHF